MVSKVSKVSKEGDMKRGIVLGLIFSLMLTGAACAKSAGEVAPDVTLEDLDGKKINLSNILSKKLVLLDFWASWCPPCREEAPRVQEFYEKYKDKVAVIGINVNESRKTVSGFMKKTGLSYPVAIDSGEVARKYGVLGIPTIVLIGQDGKIIYLGHSVREAEGHLQLSK